MNTTPVDYMPVKQPPPANAKKEQNGPLYLNDEALKRIKRNSGSIESFSMTAFRFSGISPTPKFIRTYPPNFIKSYVSESYDGHKIDRGIKTFVGWIVDTLA